MKYHPLDVFELQASAVAPARERGLKYLHNCFITLTYNVAPARERGLKYVSFEKDTKRL